MDLFFISITLLLLHLLYLIFKPRDSPLPPGPYPWPVIGNLFSLGTKPHVTLTKLAQLYGPLFSLKIGSKLVVVGSSPRVVKEILKTHDRVFAARHVPHTIHAKSPELNSLSIVWASECTDAWKQLRTICRTEIFSSKAIESQAYVREKKVRELIDFLGSKEGREVSIVKPVFTVLINVISELCFSKNFIDIHDEGKVGDVKDVTRKIMEFGGRTNFADYFPILGGKDIQGLHKKFLECAQSLFAAWDKLIEERKQCKTSDDSTHRDVLSVLLANGFSNEGIHHFIFDLFVAGSDTTSSTVEWLMTELIKNKEVMDKVNQEIAREMHTEYVKETDLPRLTYLNACVKETLRLHPPGSLVPHRALETCKVMNYTIPKDSEVLVNLWALGRDSETWEDPTTFKPTRFLNSELDFKGNDFQLVPFSAGRRICPGLPMAAKLIPLIVASMLHCFDWYLPSNISSADLDMAEKFGLTLQKEQPLRLIPKIKK